MNHNRLWLPVLALLFDLIAGDPANRYHPVAWMGTAIQAARHRAPRGGRLWPLTYGALLVLGGAAVVASLGRMLEHVLSLLPLPLHWLATAGILKTTIALRGLGQAAAEVQAALEAGDLPEARRLVSWHLVSRDTTALTESQVAAATIESVAENTSDGIVGPLFYFALGGLPGAFAYRWINTCDSMLGYRDAEREWLGKVPARLDDLLNLAPARLTAALLTMAAALTGDDAGNAWHIWHRDAGTTESPNAGHPMSAAAGALGVELEKVDHYRLGAGQRAPGIADVGRAVSLMRGAVALGAGLLLACSLVRIKRVRGKRRRKV
jgi:adenosylcobinamide-phosphate synthase